MTGLQSMFAPMGPEAALIADLAAVLFVGAAVVLTIVVAALWFAMLGSSAARRGLAAERAVIVGGIVFPIVALAALLAYGLWVMRASVASPAASNAMRIEVTGEQWWWRVAYRDGDGRRIESANEIRIPVGRDVVLTLRSADVIHSFWVPSLAGKVDMIPGRVNTLKIVAKQPGVYRGQCAEYCGGAHALMALEVVALPEAEFASWLAAEGAQATDAAGETERQGRELFLAAGCGACHAIRGTRADGRIGPDLTRVGARRQIAAATLPATRENLARFIVDGQHLKPGNGMPPFRVFSAEELSAVVAYLASLK
ncbi:MAG: cytochrome c oxidase subunit II [Alphaproteobacteria bacterium]|nr:cytochrome c oxidase subunit II [Alphaproteobacteria bacterium]